MSFVCTQFKCQTVLCDQQIGPYLGKSGPESDGNEEVLYIHQSFSITEASPSDYLISYPGH